VRSTRSELTSGLAPRPLLLDPLVVLRELVDLGDRPISHLLPGPAIGARFAHSTASSFDVTLRIQKPGNSSLVSPYGPSITTGGADE
jgi:hypothetical protein